MTRSSCYRSRNHTTERAFVVGSKSRDSFKRKIPDTKTSGRLACARRKGWAVRRAAARCSTRATRRVAAPPAVRGPSGRLLRRASRTLIRVFQSLDLSRYAASPSTRNPDNRFSVECERGRCWLPQAQWRPHLQAEFSFRCRFGVRPPSWGARTSCVVLWLRPSLAAGVRRSQTDAKDLSSDIRVVWSFVPVSINSSRWFPIGRRRRRRCRISGRLCPSPPSCSVHRGFPRKKAG